MSTRLRVLCLLGFLAIAISLPLGSETRAQSTHRAGLVIQFGDGTATTHCISFTEDTLSGFELLQRSELPVVASYAAQGAAVCKIGNDGCPADDCFCQSPPDYWSYWHLQNGAWVYAGNGSSTSTITDGSVDGWAWGAGNPPVLASFDQVCAATLPTATATSTPTATTTNPGDLTTSPTASLTPTASPTPTSPIPSPTPTPTLPTSRLQMTQPVSSSGTPTSVIRTTSTTPIIVETPVSTAISPQLFFPPRRFSIRPAAPEASTLNQLSVPTIQTNNQDTVVTQLPTPRSLNTANSQNPTSKIPSANDNNPLNYLIFALLTTLLAAWLAVLHFGSKK